MWKVQVFKGMRKYNRFQAWGHCGFRKDYEWGNITGTWRGKKSLNLIKVNVIIKNKGLEKARKGFTRQG